MDATKSAEANEFTYWRYGKNIMEPVAPVGIITQQINDRLADDINRNLRQLRQNYVKQHPDLLEFIGYERKDYRMTADLKRLNTGEGQAQLIDSIRGHDLYIISDVLNDSIYTNRFGVTVSLSPDDHFQDLCRLIAATHGSSTRINVIMPFLYEGRRHMRPHQASMDCALMLRQLFSLGVSNFITFDAQDSRVSNAVPRHNFENFPTAQAIIAKLLQKIPDLRLDKDHFMVISPAETAINKAIYYAAVMKVPLGTFFRVFQADGEVDRDFFGDDVAGRDLVIIDDILDTADSVLSCANYLKERGANRIFILSSFALFTGGYESMNQAYDFGVVDKVFATNLTRPARPLMDAPWFESVDMSLNIAEAIDALNHNASLSALLNTDAGVLQLLEEYNSKVQATEK